MHTAAHIQADDAGRLHHLLTTEGLSREQITEILDAAETFLPSGQSQIQSRPLLKDHMVVNLFFEPSTRTRTTFEIAAKRLCADVLNMQMESSSKTKGETDLDTLLTLEAMGVDMFVIRHPDKGATASFAQEVGNQVAILNAGDGANAHPTQALLDAFTIRRHKPDFANLSIAIVGDVLHSRVAHSNIHALKALGVPDIRIIAPDSLMMENPQALGVEAYNSLSAGLKDVDVVMGLRLQHERMHEKKIDDLESYHRDYGITLENMRLLKPEAIVMHPGPINRGVEIDSAVAYGERSVILEQVRNGIAVRMAVMAMIMGNR